MKKRTKVTQARLIQPRTGIGTPKLFLSGFVRKNIQYAANPMVELPPTPLTMTTELLSTINSLTVDVPFDCVAPITSFLTPPVGPFLNTRNEFDFLVSRPLGTGFPEKDTLMSTDLSQFHQEKSTEFFNEQVFVELISADITEWDESLNRVPIPGLSGAQAVEEGTFTQMSEKMVLIEVKIPCYSKGASFNFP
ncbi:CsxC family protein [Aneurinibacillus sp. Ricciae_BoGa-3]|uniref:CsxC family protein n=1 Tax=Aneurinibacillus sp. Ricciae_BoGa-3 TaxID=3022697 RepID=UPI003FA483D3